DYPVADGHMFSIAGDGLAILALPSSPPVMQYGMIFELHDSTGHAWNAADISADVGTYGPGTFDTVDWSVQTGSGTEGFSISMVGMVIGSTPDASGGCCLGDGWCATTGEAACTGPWTLGADCATVSCAPAGACCKPAGGCELLTQAACAAIANAVY